MDKEKINQIAEIIKKAADQVAKKDGTSREDVLKRFADGLLAQSKRNFLRLIGPSPEYDPANDPSHPMHGWKP